MHELHVMNRLFQDLLQEAHKQHAVRVTDVYLAMGDFSEINEDILRYFFQEQGKNTLVEGALVHIEKSPVRELRLLSFDCE